MDRNLTPPDAPSRDSTSWLLGLLAREPRWNRNGSRCIVYILIAAIGYADYLLGAHVSLKSLHFIPVAFAVIWLGSKEALVAAVASTAAWYLADHLTGASGAQGWSGAWNAVITICSFLITIWVLQALVNLQRRMEDRVRERTAQLEQAVKVRERLREELMEISAQERNSIGHEIHDGLCQHLTGVALSAKVHAERLARENDPAAGEARELIKLLQDGIGQTRRLARGLLLSAIEPGALEAELRELVGVASGQSDTACSLVVRGDPFAPDATTAAQLYRIAQEAVRNAVNHARATVIVVTLSGENGRLELLVADNGEGLPPREVRRNGLGLSIMGHRAAAIGGEFEIASRPGEGTWVICRLAASEASV